MLAGHIFLPSNQDFNGGRISIWAQISKGRFALQIKDDLLKDEERDYIRSANFQ